MITDPLVLIPLGVLGVVVLLGTIFLVLFRRWDHYEQEEIANPGATEDWSPARELADVERMGATGEFDRDWLMLHLDLDDIVETFRERSFRIIDKAIAQCEDDSKWFATRVKNRGTQTATIATVNIGPELVRQRWADFNPPPVNRLPVPVIPGRTTSGHTG